MTLTVLWVFGFTEFSYLSPRIIKALYNFFAPAYRFKWLSPFYTSQDLQERLFLQPLMQPLEGKKDAVVLDLACGSGRLSLKLLEQNAFVGRIEAIDFSEGMLQQFKSALKGLSEEKIKRLNIVQADLSAWEDNGQTFDAIMLCEVGEFLPNFPQLVEQISLSLKPNGLFLLTKPPEWLAWMYFGRKQTTKELSELFRTNNFSEPQIFSWTPRYDVVHVWKRN